MKKIIALLMALLMVGAVLAACGKTEEKKSEDKTAATEAAATADSATADSAASVADLEKVQKAGKLIVGITDFEPMDYQKDGKWIGFDADMATKFAESLGVTVEFVEIDWDNKVLELNGGSVDCVWNGMTLTPEVTSAMSCSNAYLNNAQVVVVNKNVADKYGDAESCKTLSFAVESGSAGQEQAEANGFKFTEVKDQATALMEVASGTCDAAIIDSLMASAMVGEGTGYEQLTYTVALNSEEYGVGFRKGSDLTAKCNEFFASAKADGTLKAVAEQYKVQTALIEG
ncbi:transporter substrate-binding domain-containing protein [Ruminococcus difficilis]|uniref:Transporter substrate-binding domain-containing protein n=1 Tax=Ruminococcus difficilis TaxID=2763069 RepID=A0A934WQK4_9FIRM|nr:transporter substrate-binding domain-containing protein [Ruminococcus difficilis]MBK6088163.1 transporter substrate-binding domain-containing protein [Ruminococcus difficilis]